MSSNVSLKESNDETLFFEVRSGSRREVVHDVYYDKTNGWVCTCEQYYYRKKFCKHMRLAREYYESFIRVMGDDTVYAEKK